MAFARGPARARLGLDSPHELLRSRRGVSGEVELLLELAPRPEYGLVRPLFRRTEDGGRTFGGPSQVAVTAAVPVDGRRTRPCAPPSGLAAGEQRGLRPALGAGRGSRPSSPAPAEAVADRIDDTVEAWRSWEAEHDIYEGPHASWCASARGCSKGLTYRPTGRDRRRARPPRCPRTRAASATGTTASAWIRDASLTLEALYIGTCSDEAEDFVSFMTSCAGGRVEGRLAADHVRDRRGARPLRARAGAPARLARLAPGARRQRRLGPDAARRVRRAAQRSPPLPERLGDLHPEIQEFVADLADAAAEGWRGKDAGMWEMRGEPRSTTCPRRSCAGRRSTGR